MKVFKASCKSHPRTWLIKADSLQEACNKAIIDLDASYGRGSANGLKVVDQPGSFIVHCLDGGQVRA